eukprot:gene12392-19166_t
MATISVMLLNIVSVVAIVIINKKIYEHGFTFYNTLMTMHFIATTVGVGIYQKLGGFELPETPPTYQKTFPIAACQLGSVMFVNYSLAFNSVGLYQILKLANIPVLCVVEFFWKGITYSLPVLSSLTVLLSGIGVSMVTDVSVNYWGLFHGVMATLTTAALQISVKDLSKGMTNEQSCYYVSPVSAMLFGGAALVLDGVLRLQTFDFSFELIVLLLVSCVCAFCINLSVFIIVGKTSPVTYQVVGHVKTILVIVGDFVLFS